MTNTINKTRDYLFDNYKVLLIFFVVVGHFTGPSVSDNPFLLILKWFIVSFHMPAFIFISGYFSKRTLPFSTTFQRLAIPYIAYEIIYYLWYILIVHKETNLALLKPKFTLWYLLALFFWRVITPYVKKIPGYLLFAFIGGFLIGFSNMENNFLTIPRALVYYPFYLAGTIFDRSSLDKLRTPKGKIFAGTGIVLVLCFLTFTALTKTAPMQVFYGRYNYISMKQGFAEGLLWRLLLYVIGFLMTFAFMVLLTDKKMFFSYIGTRTMAIYLFHGLLYTYLDNATKLLENLNTLEETFLLLTGCFAVTAIFSAKPFTRFTNVFTSLKLPNPKKHT